MLHAETTTETTTRPLHQPALPAQLRDEPGRAIRILRGALGWKQAELAEHLGTSRSAVSSWERGVHHPGAEQLAQLAGLWHTHAPVETPQARRAPQRPALPPPVTEAPEDLDPYEATIDWSIFFRQHPEGSGLSVRAMVEAGLYANFQDAKRAAERDGYDSVFMVTIKTASHGGRPAEDIIFTSWREAQRFCTRARTQMGDRIADLILDHHTEFQKLLSGDAEARERLHDAQARHAAPTIEVGDDPTSVALKSALEVHQRTLRLEAQAAQHHERLHAIEERFTRLAGERTGEHLAREAGWYSTTGRPHIQAVCAAMLTTLGDGFEGIRQVELPGGVFQWVFSGPALARWYDDIRPRFEAQGDELRVSTGSKTFRVRRRDHPPQPTMI